MGLKKLYYKLEDKYYNFVERTGLYKITDKIDKVMPSFVLFLLLILIIIAGIVLLVISGKGASDSIDIQFKLIDAKEGFYLEDVTLLVSTSKDIFTLVTETDGITNKIKVPKETKYQVDIIKENYENFNEIFDSKTFSETVTIALEPISITPPTVSYSFSAIDSQTNEVINRLGNVSFKCLNGGLAPSPKSLSNGNITVDAAPECVLAIESITFSGYVTAVNIPITNNTATIQLNPQDIQFGGEEVDVTFNVKNSIGDLLSNIKVTLTNDFGVTGNCITNTSGNCTISDVTKGEYLANFADMRAVPIYSSLSQTYYLSEDSTRTVVLSTDVKGYIYVKIVGQASQVIEDAEVSIKTQENNTIETKYSDSNGHVIFTVPEIRDYNVVVDAEGYLIERRKITAQSTMPTNPTIIQPTLITPGTLASLNVRVLTWDGKGFKFAKVVLYDAETGFLTDYKPLITNYDGNAVFNISSGKYIAKAIKGGTEGTSTEFEFNVKFPDNTGTITIPMGINEGTLNVNVVDRDNNPVPNARIDVYDRYSYYSNFPAIPIKSELTNSQGNIEFYLDAENDYYVVASDHLDDFYGKTQSRFIRVVSDSKADLLVTLYPKNSSTTMPRMIFTGIFKDGKEIKDNLKAGEDYKVRYNLLIPQNRTGDDIFEEIGFMIRTGSTSMIENDSLFIKHLDVPYLDSVQKYTQFNINPPHESEGFKDSDSLTESDFKWAKATLKEGPINYQGALGYYNAYEIEAIISVKDIAVFGEELKIFNLGYALTEDDVYQTHSPYLGPNQLIEYYDVYDHITYGVGDELFCSTEFCFSSNIIDVSNDLRYDVTENFGAKPNKEYKYNFTLINNSLETRYISSRFILENIDEGLDIKNIKIIKPNGEIFTKNNPSEYSFDIPITQLLSKQKVTGEITFIPKLKGTRNLSIRFISDQRIRFINQLFVEVASEKEFFVEVDPKVIPAGKNFSLTVNANDSVTNLPVKDTFVTIKDRFKDVIRGPVLIPSSTGELLLTNIPAQGPNDVIYVYVTSPEYQTNITELRATDKLFNITPRNLTFSLNIFNEKQKTDSFTINNISPVDLTITSLEVKGTGLEIVDLQRINNDLLNSVGIVIKGLDTLSDFPDNTDASKQIPLTISLNPRAEAIRDIQNLTSTLKIVLSSGDSQWVSEVPIRINVGFDGMLDNPGCLTLSNSFWKEVSLDKPVETTFMINNTCTINNTKMPLSNGIEARVLFDSNPQGRFILSIDDRFIELTHGNYRKLIDTVDRDRSYPIILRYEPIGRMKGTVKGKIEFRSLNSTGTGNQELLSEIGFEIDVTNLKDCAVFSKTLLNVGVIEDSFTIENKGCPVDITYRVSCDDCPGLIVEPRGDITVSKTGTSEPITVRSMGAMPGAYILNVYGDMDSRQTESAIKKIKVYVRPTDYCLDLERYEFDLYRGEYSENTGMIMSANSYDITNIINLCYSQDVMVTFDVKENTKWNLAFASFLRDGIFSTGVSAILQNILDGSTNIFGGKTKLQKSIDSSQLLIDNINSQDLNNDQKKELESSMTTLNNAIASGDKERIDQAYNNLQTKYTEVTGTSAPIDQKKDDNKEDGIGEIDIGSDLNQDDLSGDEISSTTYKQEDYTDESWAEFASAWEKYKNRKNERNKQKLKEALNNLERVSNNQTDAPNEDDAINEDAPNVNTSPPITSNDADLIPITPEDNAKIIPSGTTSLMLDGEEYNGEEYSNWMDTIAKLNDEINNYNAKLSRAQQDLEDLKNNLKNIINDLEEKQDNTSTYNKNEFLEEKLDSSTVAFSRGTNETDNKIYYKEDYTDDSWNDAIDKINELIDLYHLDLDFINNSNKTDEEKENDSLELLDGLDTALMTELNNILVFKEPEENPEPPETTAYLDLDNLNNFVYNGEATSVPIINQTITTLNSNKTDLYEDRSYSTINALSNNEICTLNNCIDYSITQLTEERVGSLIGYTSPNSEGAIGYVAIYLGEKDGNKKILRVSGSQQKYIVENLSDFNTTGYNSIKIIEPK